MKRAVLSIWYCLCAPWLGGLGLNGAMAPQDTVVPDSFWLTQETYVVPAGATNLEISVMYQPGNRGYSGAVDYYTEDDTARDGVDFLGSSGQIHFSGVRQKTFNISILPSSSCSRPKTFRVFLSHSKAHLWNVPATVTIESAPRLQCSTHDGKLVLSWPADCPDYILESSANPDCSGSRQASSSPVLVNGRWQIEEQASAEFRFYRLRKN